MFVDAVFELVLDIFRLIGVSRVVRSDWHDPCGQQVVVPVECIVGAVTDNPERLAVSSGACLLSVNSAAIGVFCPVETVVQP